MLCPEDCGTNNDNRYFKIDVNKIITIMADVKSRVSCRKLFQEFNILLLASKYKVYILLTIIYG
jgi:hypothetical protein